MSQRTKIIIGVVALILGAAAIGWLYFQLSPDAWDSFVADMSGDNATSRPAAQPVVQRFRVAAGKPSNENQQLMSRMSKTPTRKSSLMKPGRSIRMLKSETRSG